jgi:uncharacterized delta-60 repeat protein
VQAGDNILVNQTDKKYIIRGWVNPYGAYLKYNQDGRLDTNFNKTGVLVQPNSERYVRNFLFDGSGNLINAVAKTTLINEMGFMRTRPSGIPDSTFGTNGIYYIPNTSMAEGCFLPLPNGKFLMVSNYWYGDTVGIKLQQFKSYYALDSSFGTNGAIIHKLGFYDMYVRKVQVFDDGKILIAGTARSSPPYKQPYDYDALMVRCLPGGTLDQSFGKKGLLMPYAKNSPEDQYYGSYILTDKKFLGYGFEDGQGFIARYQYDGSTDSSFGVLGRVFIPEAQFFNMQQQRDGKFIVAGGGGYTIARITEDGARDAMFGNNGVYQSPAPINLGFPYGSLLENDSTFLLTGNAFESNQSNNITTARYKIRFQPFVTGVRSRYCIGDNVIGTIINLPQPASDTLITVLLDKTTVLPVNSQGQFSFLTGVAGLHTIEVRFTKATNIWNEIIQFTTGTIEPISITTVPQTICQDGSALVINASTPCYWQGNGLSVKSPSAGILFKPLGLIGPQQVIAFRDNAGCKPTMDTVVLELVQLNPVITENAGVLNTTVRPASTYKWYLNNNIIPGATSAQYMPTKNGYYTVMESLSNCSKTSAPFPVTSFPEPLPIPQISNIAKEYCGSATLQQGRLLNPPAPPATINVIIDGTVPVTYYTTDSSFFFNIYNIGNHTITVTYVIGTQNKRKDTTCLVKPVPSAGAAPALSGNMLTIPVSATAYQWYRNGNKITGAVMRDYTITQSGQYAYTYTVNDCISPMSTALNASITAIIDPTTNRPVFFSPNPAKGHVYISGLNEQFTYQVQIIDLRGVPVMEVIIARQNQADLYIDKLSKGMYLVRLRNISKKRNMGTEKIEVL